MASKIILIFLLMTSVCYAEISNVTIDDVKDHPKIMNKLNEIIGELNREKVASDNKLNKTYDMTYKTKYDVELLKYNLGRMSTIVGQPDPTAGSIKTKFLLLMDTIDKSPSQHIKVSP